MLQVKTCPLAVTAERLADASCLRASPYHCAPPDLFRTYFPAGMLMPGGGGAYKMVTLGLRDQILIL